MAFQTSAFLKGKLGNIVFYTRNGRHIARSVPDKVRQTDATKQRSKNFGIASAAGKPLRGLLAPVLPFPKDRSMQVRFSGVLAKWLALQQVHELVPQRPLPFVTGFCFNPATSITERVRIPFRIETQDASGVRIIVPAFVPVKSISAPAHTTLVDVHFSVASCNLLKAAATGSSIQSIRIPYTSSLQPEQELFFPVAAVPGSVVLVAASVIYTLQNGKQELRPAFLPSAVIDAWYL
ncbi:hypothetical protein [Lacibacter sp.]|uniref:hypothetical protein n=1 Tax=Lacibacter sp. TaxID=1915409 RepID=UPI002B4B8D20|nr:hypothetical protein [Lacibacter sp.]HLP39772.1 hypothetical protein [Lacibacter sp.]